MKTWAFLLILIGFFTACKPSDTKKKSNENSSISEEDTILMPNSNDFDKNDASYKSYYLVICDTSQNYNQLLTRMLMMHGRSNMDMDTAGRAYNERIGRIVQTHRPKGDDSTLVPPRYKPSGVMSIEHLANYIPSAENETFVLVTGIYASGAQADSAFRSLKNICQDAYLLKVKLPEN